MLYVQSITDVLSSHLGWHRARLKFMARFTSAMLSMKTTNLRRIAIALKAGVEAKPNYRRIQRFLGEYDFDAAALGRFLLRLLPQEAPYKVVIDRTEWHFGEMPVRRSGAGRYCPPRNGLSCRLERPSRCW